MAQHIEATEQVLLRIEHPDYSLTIAGRPVHPVAQALGVIPAEQLGLSRCAHLMISDPSVAVRVFDADDPDHLVPWVLGEPVYPCFYEQTSYTVAVRIRTPGLAINFWHRNDKVARAVKSRGDTDFLFGTVNFHNDIGLTAFELRSDRRTMVRIEFEVFPVKLDYRRDYHALIQEVSEEIYNLTYDFWRRTWQKVSPQAGAKSPSPAEKFAILHMVFARFSAAFERIKRAPHTRIVTVHDMTHADRVRRTDTHSQRWLGKHPEVLVPTKAGVLLAGMKRLPEKIPDARKRVTTDTYENRVLKWMLTKILADVRELEGRYRASMEEPETEVEKIFSSMAARLRGMLAADCLQDLSNLNRADGQSLVLQMAPGYRDVYVHFLLMQRGLSLTGSMFDLSIKDTAVLYEYWCFLVLARIMRQKFGRPSVDLVKLNKDGLAVELKRGRESRLAFRNPVTGESYSLSYNERAHAGVWSSSSRMPTVNQRPDTMLVLSKEGSKTSFTYAFDAKYRLDPAIEGSVYAQSYGAGMIGPNEDDINTMHRYRDSVVVLDKDSERYRRQLFGAVVLFPYANRNDKYEDHQFYRSLYDVGIGGLPFLPGNTKLVEGFLQDLFQASPEAVQEATVESLGIDEYYTHRFSKRNVLVGVTRTPLQRSVNLEKRFYHTPVRNVSSSRLNQIEYVALYEGLDTSPINGIHWVGRVKAIEQVPRREIKDIPMRPGRSADEMYHRFIIDHWEQIPHPIRPMGRDIRISPCFYTSRWLLDQARFVPELLLKDYTDVRLWQELRRLTPKVNAQSDELVFHENSVVSNLSVDGQVVSIWNGSICVNHKPVFTLAEFRRRPLRALRTLRDALLVDYSNGIHGY